MIIHKKEILVREYIMVKGNSNGLKESKLQYIKGIIHGEKKMEKALFLGIMEINIMVAGKVVFHMEKEFSKLKIENIMEIGDLAFFCN